MNNAKILHTNLFRDSNCEAIIQLVRVDREHNLASFDACSTHPRWATFTVHLKDVPDHIASQILSDTKFFRVHLVFKPDHIEIERWMATFALGFDTKLGDHRTTQNEETKWNTKLLMGLRLCYRGG